MPDFTATFEVHEYRFGQRETDKFYGYSKEEAIRLAKKTADEKGYRTIYLAYMHSGKTVGYWEKRGSRWYKE